MNKLTFFDLLGVGTSGEAADLWPRSSVQFATGLILTGAELEDFQSMMAYLNAVLTFKSIRPGSATDQVDLTGAGDDFEPLHRVGLTAEMEVSHFGVPEGDVTPLVLTQLNETAFYLLDTEGYPARLFVTRTDLGVEVVIEGLPVEIQLPPELIAPLLTSEEEEESPGGIPDLPLTDEPFAAGTYDSLEIILRDPKPSIIRTYIKVRMTEEGGFIVETATPISIGPCRYLLFPCKAVHDFALVPSPTLSGDHHPTEQALEWTRHGVDPLEVSGEHVPFTGVYTARSLDFDYDKEPLKSVMDRMNQDIEEVENELEFVLEDLVMQVGGGSLLPLHARFGLRRKVITGSSVLEAYDLELAPAALKIPLVPGDIRLEIFRLLIDTAEPAPTLRGAFVSGQSSSDSSAATINLTEEGLLQVGWLWGDPYGITLLGINIELKGLKVGFGLPDIGKDFGGNFQVLGDFQIRWVKKEDGPNPFAMESKSGKEVDVYWYDVGYDRGKPSLTNIKLPDDFEISVAKVFKFRIDEFGVVTENNGGHYLMFSGGFPLFAGEKKESENGIYFRRLRFRIDGNDNTPAWLLDGIELKAKIGRVQLSGAGMISQFNEGGHDYREMGFGVEASFKALGKNFLLAMQILRGKVSGPVHNFTYGIFAFSMSASLPVSPSFQIYNIRLLAAKNMGPQLDPPDPEGQEMRLFKWYKSNPNGLTLLKSRVMSAWEPVDEAFAFGIGARATTAGTETIALDLFAFGHRSPSESGFLVGLEVYALESPKPIGFGVFEWDINSGKWGLLFGLSLKPENVLRSAPSFLSDLASLTGTLYFGNKPSTIALGQLSDPASWLSFQTGTADFFDASLFIGICYQRVAVPQGPNAFAFLISLKGGKNLGIGKVQAYIELGLIIGMWRNESGAGGVLFTFEAGLRIKVFWVFNFGIMLEVNCTYLASSPSYRRFDALLKIDTPWYMPDVTFHFERVKNRPEPETVSLLSTPLVSAGAVNPADGAETNIGLTSFTSADIDSRSVYTIAELTNAVEPSVSDQALAQLTPVGIDSVIALNFKPSMKDRLTIGENTPAGAGVEAPLPPAKGDLKATYELVELSIRRRPRFAGGGASWMTILSPEDTRIGELSDYPPDADSGELFRSFISLKWDKDYVRDGNWDARRLLINSATPYSFFSSNPETDEIIAHQEPGWPCCPEKPDKEFWHELHFIGTPFGVRAPAMQLFSESHSTLQWLSGLPPVVVPGITAPPASHAARVLLDILGSGDFAVVNFDKPAQVCEIFAYWEPSHSHSAMVITGYRGLEQVFQQHYPLLNAPPPAPLKFEDDGGLTSIEFRFAGDEDQGAPRPSRFRDIVEFTRMRYRTVQEQLDDLIRDARCGSQNDAVLEGGGTLAWLPNHEYEITAVARMILDHSETGAPEVEVKQKAYFATKGLIGLNAVAAIGDEVAPYVESTYPALQHPRLYREEAVALAFTEQFNILLPVDFLPSPDDPEELRQKLEWVLAVEQLASDLQPRRISQTAKDWVVENRGLFTPPKPGDPVVVDPTVVQLFVRQATTFHRLLQRFENMIFSPFGCQPGGKALHRSQVLTHQPLNPAGAGNNFNRWEANAVYRVNVRRKNGPFVERKPFEPEDHSAFTPRNESGAIGRLWHSVAGQLRVADPLEDGVRQYAVFGGAEWDHVQIRSIVDPKGNPAGIAVGMRDFDSATDAHALLALVDDTSRILKIVEKSGPTITELASDSIAPEEPIPFGLEVIAYDDKLRARVGDTVVEADRHSVREGQLALVVQDTGVFSSLTVEAIDAYRFQFQASRFLSFDDHIGSFVGQPAEIPHGIAGTADQTVSALLSATGPDIDGLMQPEADAELRQRLFDTWTQGLSLPLKDSVNRLEVSRLTRAGHTEALLLDSPEPLPFTTEVTVDLKQHTFVLPLPGKLPLLLRRIVLKIDFRDDRVTLGPVKLNAKTKPLEDLRWLVHAVEDGARLVYRVYNMARPVIKMQQILNRGRLSDVISPVRGRPTPFNPLLKVLSGMEANDVALLDKDNTLLFGDFLPMGASDYVSVRLKVLTNGPETRVLLIPVNSSGTALSPLPSGTFRLDFEMDRVRFRAEIPDEVSNYRAEASIGMEW